MRGRILLLLVALSRPAGARAPQERPSETQPYTTRVLVEELNDSLSVYAFSDSLWTHALRFQAMFRSAAVGADQAFVGFSAGQEIYTPEEISPAFEADELGVAPPDQVRDAFFRRWMEGDGAIDRPYSGWLYVGAAASLEAATRQVLLGRAGLSRLELELQLGAAGPPSYAGEFQTAMHRLTRRLTGNPYPRDPQGWEFASGRDTEIDAHFGALAIATWHRDLLNTGDSERCVLDACLGLRIAGLTQARLGSVRDDAGVGMSVETGLVGYDPYRRLRQRAPGRAMPEVGTRLSSFALVVRAHVLARGILFDRHLDNRPFDDAAPEREKKPWGLQMSHGLALRWLGLELEYLVLHRVKELRRPLLPGLHQAGVLRVGARW